MMRSLLYLVCVVWCCYSTWAFPGYNLDLMLNRTRRGAWCRDTYEYPNGDICCRKCRAGTHLKTHCTRDRDQSECEECPLGTFTEHDNELKQCLSCTPCRLDQEMVRQCDSTHDIKCRCRPGRFCTPDEACEVCRKCARCGEDEVVVRNCTPTSNTECKKVPQDPAKASDLTAVYVTLGSVALLGLTVTGLVCYMRRRRQTTDSEGNQPDLTPGYNGTEKSNGPTPHCWTLADEPHFNIVPVNGETSLRSCFEFFEELDVYYHSRFFRHLGLSDNMIKSKEGLPYSDRVHDLLNFWLEKRGREANLKDLLKSLMDLNQRRTAEIVVERAVEAGYYVYE